MWVFTDGPGQNGSSGVVFHLHEREERQGPITELVVISNYRRWSLAAARKASRHARSRIRHIGTLDRSHSSAPDKPASTGRSVMNITTLAAT
jgi:hypothetical protein